MENNFNKEVIKQYFGISESIVPLKFNSSKKMVEQYKKFTHHYLLRITEVDEAVLDKISTLLRQPSSYEHQPEEFTQIKKSIGHLLEMVNLTASLPHFKVSSISDFMEESKVNLFVS